MKTQKIQEIEGKIAQIEKRQSREWRLYRVYDAYLAKLQAKLETAKRGLLARAKMETILDAKRYVQRGLKATIEHLRISVRLLVDHYLTPAFKILQSLKHRLAGAFFGIGKRIASGGKYTWRQFTFWQSLAFEAGYSV